MYISPIDVVVAAVLFFVLISILLYYAITIQSNVIRTVRTAIAIQHAANYVPLGLLNSICPGTPYDLFGEKSYDLIIEQEMKLKPYSCMYIRKTNHSLASFLFENSTLKSTLFVSEHYSCRVYMIRNMVIYLFVDEFSRREFVIFDKKNYTEIIEYILESLNEPKKADRLKVITDCMRIRVS